MKMKAVQVPEGFWWPDVFYNIGYRAYSKDVKVESVTKHDAGKFQKLLLMRPETNY